MGKINVYAKNAFDPMANSLLRFFLTLAIHFRNSGHTYYLTNMLHKFSRGIIVLGLGLIGVIMHAL